MCSTSEVPYGRREMFILLLVVIVHTASLYAILSASSSLQLLAIINPLCSAVSLRLLSYLWFSLGLQNFSVKCLTNTVQCHYWLLLLLLLVLLLLLKKCGGVFIRLRHSYFCQWARVYKSRIDVVQFRSRAF